MTIPTAADALPPCPFAGYEEEDAAYNALQRDVIRWESWQADVLAAWIMHEFPHLRYVCDCGCSSGTYLVPFKLMGVREVLGLDACSKGGILLAPSEYRRADLRFPHSSWLYGYDLCLCLETAEHLPEPYADTLMDNVCGAAPLVLWSAALPGQGGTHHHHEAPHEYWLEKFHDRGFSLHEKSGELRRFLSQSLSPLRAVGAVSGWLIDNSWLLEKVAA